MSNLPPSLQISLLVTGGFLLGMLFVWLYWRRKLQETVDNVLFDKEREIEKLRDELDLLEIDGTKVSPSEYVRSKKSILFRKDEKINQLQSELDHLQIDGEKVSASHFIIRSQKEIEVRDKEISQLKNRLTSLGYAVGSEEALPNIHEELEEKNAEVQQLKGLLGTFQIDGREVSPIEFIRKKRKEVDGYREQIQKLQQQLDEKDAQTSLSKAEPYGESITTEPLSPIDPVPEQRAEKLFEYRGQMMNADAYQSLVEEELRSRDEQLQQFTSELDSLLMNNEEGNSLSPREAFSQLKTQIAERDSEIAHMRAEFELILDENDSGTDNPLSPKEAFAKLKKDLANKNAEIATLKKQVAETKSDDHEEEMTYMSPAAAFAAYQKLLDKPENSNSDTSKTQIEDLQQRLDEKNKEVESLKSQLALSQTQEKDEESSDQVILLKKLEEEIENKNREISHFNEELDELGIESPHTEHRIGLPEALRLVKVKLIEKESRIEELEEKLEKSLAGQEESATTPQVSEEVGKESPFMQSLSEEATELRKGMEEAGLNLSAGIKGFMPASVYDELISLEGQGLSISDQQGFFLVFNQQLQEMLGYTKADANDRQGKSFLERLYPDPNYRAEVGRNISSIPEDGSFHTSKAYITSKDGSIKAIDVSSTSFYFAGKKYYLSYYMDKAAS